MNTGYIEYDGLGETVRVYLDRTLFRADRQWLRENGWRPLDLSDGRYAGTTVTEHFTGCETPVFAKRV